MRYFEPSRTRVAVALVQCALLTSCSTDDNDHADHSANAASQPPSAGSLRVGTYNAGLAPGDVPHVDERSPEIISALAEQDLDVLCLQEVWRAEDWESLAEALDERLPHRVRLEPDAECAKCSPVELDPLAACIEVTCADALDADLVACAIADCGAEVEVLSGGCAGCLVGAATDGRSFGEVSDACAGPSDGDVPSYLYDCSFDTALATSREPVDSDSLVLDSYLVRAAVHHARLESELGEVDVFCTHLASSIGELEYRGDYDDWQDEQLHQVDQLLEFVEQRSQPDRIAILLGDLNSAPAVDSLGIPARWPAHYQRFVAAGFTNPYLQQDDVACTSCPDNTLREGQGPRLVDHVLVRGYDGPTFGERFLTGTVEVELDGEVLRTSLSDHVGLALSLGDRDP